MSKRDRLRGKHRLRSCPSGTRSLDFAAAMLDQGQGQLLHDKDQLQERALSVYSQAIDPKEQSGSSWLRRVRTLLEKL